MTACASCGKQLARSEVLYDEQAREICAACNDKREIRRDESRAARNIQTAAWSCLGLSVLGWFFNVLYVVNVGTILTGIYAIRSVMPGNERFTKYLTPGARTQIWVCAVLGLTITVIQLLLLLYVLAFVAADVHRHRIY
ncbi:MAG TPA: hypothetical protein VLX92_35075 [Kofleriaceae bacterium]|nr:hypothetical protein [Kofleriaceae bacterium]